MLPAILTALIVYSSQYPKIRMGRDHDGGYVIVNLDRAVTYDHFVSGGIGHDNSFENAILDRYPNIKGDAYDHTISKLPMPHPRLTWHRQSIGSGGDFLHSYLNTYKNIFLKMDIEGGEFPWIANITDTQLNSIAQLVIEWHNSKDFNQWHWDILARVAKTHTLVHIHVCNCCPSNNIQGVTVPNVFECVYVRKDIQNGGKLSSDPIPGPLDMRSVITLPEITLSWPPFVHTDNEL